MVNGVGILAPDATGGSGNSASPVPRKGGVSDVVGVLARETWGGQRLEEKGGAGGVQGASAGFAQGVEGGAGVGVIDVDLSG